MGFTSFKEKKVQNESKNELQVELKILENSLETKMPAGDRVIIEKKINKIQGRIELMDSTVAGDIAQATANFALCSEKEDCECGKCQLLRRPELKEAVENASPFTGFFGN